MVLVQWRCDNLAHKGINSPENCIALSLINTIMPSAENIKQIFSVASLAVLLLSLGAAGTSLGLLQANTNNGASCRFYISYTQATNRTLTNYNVPTCKLSIASATIAIICLALLTAIELISVLFKINVKM